jgi:hypothetical protein
LCFWHPARFERAVRPCGRIATGHSAKCCPQGEAQEAPSTPGGITT